MGEFNAIIAALVTRDVELEPVRMLLSNVKHSTKLGHGLEVGDLNAGATGSMAKRACVKSKLVRAQNQNVDDCFVAAILRGDHCRFGCRFQTVPHSRPKVFTVAADDNS